MSKILITTTESVSGFEIETYIKPIFASVVIGTNVFSDFNASITDFFGGRSSSYEKKLQMMNENALVILKSKASELGANCVIGLRVNSQQISGKNMQMFMLSAYGTAAIIRSLSYSKQPMLSSKELDKTSVNDKTQLVKLLKDYKRDEFKFTIQSIELILENKNEEFASLFLSKFIELAKLDFYDENQTHAKKLLLEYFAAINPAVAIPLLYQTFDGETNAKVTNEVLSLIREFDLVDVKQCLLLLNSTKLSIRKIALNILRYDQPIYVINDIEVLTKAIEKIKTSFSDLSSISTKKGFLSSNEKDVWICQCGKSNDMPSNYCFNCQYNRFGFKSDELKPDTVINQLTNKVEALKEMFSATFDAA
ncbi:MULTISPECIES: YbjQ family protein [unclassified Mucilaginibacter]|uniref:YbjQ family protein n=1 Tax=unclassified Mucilaginibacter TaxID=2617802 RepID=UPI00095A9291|nr:MULTISPECIES: YbjQ family protein [unclassified Mucilaginibacter]OJW18350.1 MAG: hypothetical protein BGO48_17545 [Mucilaginibacter sp. 44-25]PLW91314.1 MAG: hypothetical protein C0154_01865 [Mucilaginibacter sp.]HEK21437.1 YbjQ family protein [Bacteroidota bacterium]